MRRLLCLLVRPAEEMGLVWPASIQMIRTNGHKRETTRNMKELKVNLAVGVLLLKVTPTNHSP